MKEFPVTVVLMVANIIYSYLGFTRQGFLEKHMFEVGAVVQRKEYLRLVTSGFLHVNWAHLIVNMISLYYMGGALEASYVLGTSSGPGYGPLGYVLYLAVYFGSMLGGDLLALALKRNKPGYSAVGASGAVSGVIFALVVLYPYGEILLFFIIPVTFWLFAVLYVVYSLFGIRTGFGNIGHEAHLGGALIGLILGSLFAMHEAQENWILITCLTIPTIALLYLLYHNPNFTIDPIATLKSLNWGFKRKQGQSSSTRSNQTPPEKRVKQDGLEINMKAKLQAEMDVLLEKVSRKGINNLTMAERKRLDELAAYLNKPGYSSGGRAPRE
jgi:membrane associated rhomboid family serine protease